VKKSSVVKESQLKKEFLDSKEKKLNEVIKKLRTQLNQVKSSAKPTDNVGEPLKSPE
jgi:chaperonin cofactor prefoldin